MKWQTIRRETGLVEHVCEHGVGHPNHGSALWQAEGWAKRDQENESDQRPFDELVEDHEYCERIHGCDGCCGRSDFPGTYRDSLRHAHKMLQIQNDTIKALSKMIHEEASETRRGFWSMFGWPS